MTRELAIDVCRRLREAGFEAVWAGGCVRDLLLDVEPSDYDVATSATPDEVRGVFGKRRTLAVGEAFGVIIVLGRRGADGVVPQVEVATFRRDGAYADGRRPDAVEFCDAAEDARRRDFTINALFADPLAEGRFEQAVIDYVGGLDDLRARRLRAVGEAATRFDEDKLRMLRAVRFTQRLGRDFGFSLEPGTQAAIVAHAASIAVVSAERIQQELAKMLTHPARADGFALLHDVDLLSRIFPELAGDDPAARFDRLEAMERAGDWRSGDPEAVGWAMLLWPLADDGIAAVARRLAWSNRLAKTVRWLRRNAASLAAANTPLSVAKPLLADGRAAELLWAAAATHVEDAAAGAAGVRHWTRYREATASDVLNPPPLLTGADLIAEGLRPGPEFRTQLDAIRRLQLDEEISTRAEAFETLVRLRQAAARDA